MVTFIDGVPARGLYRKFKLRTVDNNDFAAMYEVLTRRFKRSMAREGGPSDDPAWGLPDLLVIDGGKGQLGMAVTALTDLGVKLGGETGIEVIGLAKERELEAGSAPDRIYRRNVKDSIALRANSPELYVLARIRDEAHRFANTFHRDRRSKIALRSELDSIPGIGATRRQRLLKHFGSVRAVRLASVEDLAKAPGMNKKAAEQVAKYFAEVAAAEADLASRPEAVYEGDDSGGAESVEAAEAAAEDENALGATDTDENALGAAEDSAVDTADADDIAADATDAD
jgi:excinuclease ABC subunit C